MGFICHPFCSTTNPNPFPVLTLTSDPALCLPKPQALPYHAHISCPCPAPLAISDNCCVWKMHTNTFIKREKIMFMYIEKAWSASRVIFIALAQVQNSNSKTYFDTSWFSTFQRLKKIRMTESWKLHLVLYSLCYSVSQSNCQVSKPIWPIKNGRDRMIKECRP